MSVFPEGTLPKPRSLVGFGCCVIAALYSIYNAVAERNPGWVLIAALWVALPLDFPQSRRARRTDAYRGEFFIRHLPCTNPSCATSNHLPPVCDFCFSQGVSWAYVGRGARRREILGSLATCLTISVVAAVSPLLFCLLFGYVLLVGLIRPQHLLRIARPLTGSGLVVWSACDTCHELIETCDTDGLVQRTAHLVPTRLGSPGAPLPDTVQARTRSLLAASPRPKCRRIEC